MLIDPPGASETSPDSDVAFLGLGALCSDSQASRMPSDHLRPLDHCALLSGKLPKEGS